tara:strand:+ start:113 stop:457 length:345 start_codon:yes stop_codon:yes gene_type:complete
MFTVNIISFFLIGSFVLVFIRDYLEEKELYKFLKFVLILLIIASIYNLLAGSFLLSGWEDPFINADAETLGRTGARRGGGLILLVIKFWPYFLIGWGGLNLYTIFFRGWSTHLK